MGTLSNCSGYQALEDFACRHHQALVERLKLPPIRFPSDSTFRRVMMGIDFTQKDVVLEEDSSRIRLGNAPANLSIICSLEIAILRNNSYSSITTALRMIAHNLEPMFLLLGQVAHEA